MNHRQWKKNFKKIHGRNPYFWEDRKIKRIDESTRYNLEKMCETISNIPKILAEILADAAEVISDGFAKVAKELREYKIEAEGKEVDG